MEPKTVAPGGVEKPVELTPIHDFAAKLRQDDLLPRLGEYVRWQARERGTLPGGAGETPVPDFAPVSINLDITTSCNYACDHCVDLEILNTGIRYEHERLLDSLRLMARKGLRSVIVIGGGEPTVYPKFEETIEFLKSLRLQVAIVSNGSGNRKIAAVAKLLDENDWVRLSLDAGSDAVFQAMHKPRKAVTLDQICAGVPEIKAINPRFKLGFSFIITWRGASIKERAIVENLHEIPMAAGRAREHGFDYIAFKPFLTRAERNNAEIVDLHESDAHFAGVVERIRGLIEEAKAFATPRFRVYETTNLKVLYNGTWRNFTRQPRRCHMQFFRQVLSPLGMYNCPVYRNQPHGQVGSKEAYATPAAQEGTRGETARLIRTFDATEQCREVTCLYNHANWWIEELIEEPGRLARLRAWEPAEADYFL